MSLSFIGWIIIGIVAGWLAEKVMGRNHGLLTNLIVGVIGGLLGGFIASNLLGLNVSGFFNPMTWLAAFGGSCLLLFLLGLIKKR